MKTVTMNPTTSRARTRTRKHHWFGKKEDLVDGLIAIDKEKEELEVIEAQTIHLSQFEMFRLFFNDDIIKLIIEETNKYRQQKNNHDFELPAHPRIRYFTARLFVEHYSVFAEVREDRGNGH